MSHPKTSLFSFSSGMSLTFELGFRPSSWYIFVAPRGGRLSHSFAQAASFSTLALFWACDKVCVFLAKGLWGQCANLFASLSAISFPFKPLWLGIYCTVMTFPLSCQFLAISQNLLKAFWLDPFGILPAAWATLRLSRQTWIALAALIIGHVTAASRPLHKPHASTSYTSACTPSANDHWQRSLAFRTYCFSLSPLSPFSSRVTPRVLAWKYSVSWLHFLGI